MVSKNCFSYFSTKTYVVGTQKIRLNDTVLLNAQNICWNWWERKYLQFYQGSKIALIRLYLQLPQASGQVKILIFLLNFYFIYVNNFCDAGQVPILRYFEACLN